MQYRKLSYTDLELSLIGLGTMTWGVQNTEEEAHAQLNYALENGVNFIDTAEMYPIPPQKKLYGITESYIGTWLQANSNKREQIIIATKVVGPGAFMRYIRNGPRLNKEHIHQALEASLKRLKTDYIDLYQLHWPERRTNFFGQLGYPSKLDKDEDAISIKETLEALAELVQSAKIKYIGVSNETAWGVHEFLRIHQQEGIGPRIVSIQNPYNLLNRSFEVGLSEFSHREKVDLLPYSPLGFGVLSGKYCDGAKPEGARLSLYGKNYSRYTNEICNQATDNYVSIANKYGLDPAQMALAFVNSRPFVASNIIGATNLKQLATNINSVDLKLSSEILKEIEVVHNRYPNPAP